MKILRNLLIKIRIRIFVTTLPWDGQEGYRRTTHVFLEMWSASHMAVYRRRIFASVVESINTVHYIAMSQISNDSWNSSEVASWVACSDLCRKRHGTRYWRCSSKGVCLKGWTWTYQEKSRTCYYYQGEQYYQIS